MSAEFAKMLKDTLEKMQERIRLAEWDNDNDPGVIKKIKEMNNLNWWIGIIASLVQLHVRHLISNNECSVGSQSVSCQVVHVLRSV